MKVLIEIRGGVLCAVTTDGQDLDIQLKDWDNTEDPVLPFEPEIVSAGEIDALIEDYSKTDDAPVP